MADRPDTDALRGALEATYVYGRGDNGYLLPAPVRERALAELRRLEARLSEAERERDEARADHYDTFARLSEYEQALDLTERDARWIVAQWARLQDKPVEEVALEIIARIVAARAALSGSAGSGP